MISFSKTFIPAAGLLLVYCSIAFMSLAPCHAQVSHRVQPSLTVSSARFSGDMGSGPTEALSDDTLYIFEPSKSLLTSTSQSGGSAIMYGPTVAISGSGYAGGAFYQIDLWENTSLAADFVISAARRSAEFEIQDGKYTYVPNKVHRVLVLPFMLSVTRVLFADAMTQNMRPYVNAGMGANWVLVGSYDPYSNDFFQSIGSALSFVRPGGFLGCGALIRNTEKTYINFAVRYYVLPYGGDGVESVRNLPMKDFNGLFLSLSVGFR